MKANIKKVDLQNALNVCLSVVEKKATMQILTNILIQAQNDKITISATDLEITAVINIPAKVITKGSTTVNAKVFGDIIREVSDADITLDLTNGERLEIESGTARIKVNCISADEFPSLPGIGINVTNSLSATQFLDMINKTIYASSTDETCFNLTGVYFITNKESQTEQLKMVATDGHRLSIITRPVSGLNVNPGVIVPKKGLSEIKRILSDLSEAEIGIGLKDGFLIIDTKEIKFSMRLIDGEFPDFKQVVPRGNESKALVGSQRLMQALRCVSLMATDKMKGVKLGFSKNELKISSSSPELGEATEKMEITYDGQPVEIGFNANYLIDVATSAGENQSLTFELNGSLGPAKIYASADPAYFAVVMPMRLT